MSGDRYSWKDGALQTLDSQLGQRIIHASWTLGDPWAGAKEQQLGVKVWRVKNAKLSPWPPEENGNFFDDDVFIVLNTRPTENDHVIHDIHVWVGKTALLADYNVGLLLVPSLKKSLVTNVLVHRQVSGRESQKFRSSFNTISVSRGSADTSYRYNSGDAYSARLYRYFRPNRRLSHYRLKEVSPQKAELQSEHHYVLDVGEKVYLWAGNVVTADEKLKAIEYCERMCARRAENTVLEVLDETDSGSEHYFYFYLQNNSDGSRLDSDDDTASNVTRQVTLSKKKGASGQAQAYRIATKEGKAGEYRRIKANKKELAGQGPVLVDAVTECFVWLGRKSAKADHTSSLHYAHDYLRQTSHPFVPVTVVVEGETPSPSFDKIIPG